MPCTSSDLESIIAGKCSHRRYKINFHVEAHCQNLSLSVRDRLPTYSLLVKKYSDIQPVEVLYQQKLDKFCKHEISLGVIRRDCKATSCQLVASIYLNKVLNEQNSCMCTHTDNAGC